MKKRLLLTLGLLFLAGCSNGEDQVKSNTKTSSIENKIDNNALESANKAVETFNTNTSGEALLEFDKNTNEFILNYNKKEHQKIIQDIADNLKDDSQFKGLEFLAKSMEVNVDNILPSAPGSKIVLKNPNDDKYDLYVIDSEGISYPATHNANDGGVPITIENLDKVIQTANFIYKPNGISHFDFDEEKLIINLSIDTKDTNTEEFITVFQSPTETLAKTLNDMYQFDYPIVINNNNEKIFELNNGDVLK